jgi:hypothetical protein
MSKPIYGGARHLSIVWAVTLAILTLMEWRQLDRDPLDREILSPFIEREVTVHTDDTIMTFDDFERSDMGPANDTAETIYEVQFHFNGPLFLICFFGPVAAFHGLALMWGRLRKN